MEKIPTKECLFVLMDANARTGQRMEGCGDDKLECLERMDVVFVTIMADGFICQSPRIPR